MMKTDKDYIGKWAVCGIGRIGKIEGRKELDWGLSWVGVGLDGKSWCSRDPKIISDADAMVLESLQLTPHDNFAS